MATIRMNTRIFISTLSDLNRSEPRDTWFPYCRASCGSVSMKAGDLVVMKRIHYPLTAVHTLPKLSENNTTDLFMVSLFTILRLVSLQVHYHHNQGIEVTIC